MKNFTTKIVVALIAGACVLAATANAQFNRDFHNGPDTHVERYSTDVSVRLGDGSFVTIGTVRNPAGDLDALVSRVDANGAQMWTRTYGHAGVDEVALGLCLSNNGFDVILTGTARSQLWITRLETAMGDVVWSRTYGEPSFLETGYVVAPFNGFGYFAAGVLVDGPSRVPYLVFVDETGAPIYQRRYDGPVGAHDQPTALLALQNEIVMVGLHRQPGAPRSLFVLPIAATSGVNPDMIIYEHTEDDVIADRLPAIEPTPNGFLTAYTVFQDDRPRIAALALDLNYNWIWERHYQGIGGELPPQDDSWGLSIDLAGNFFAIGTAHTNRSVAGLLLIDNVGNPQLLRHYFDGGFLDPAGGVNAGDTAARMATDSEGYLLKNQLEDGFSLTRANLAANAPCPDDPEILSFSGIIEQTDEPYLATAWGVVHHYPLPHNDIGWDESDCL